MRKAQSAYYPDIEATGKWSREKNIIKGKDITNPAVPSKYAQIDDHSQPETKGELSYLLYDFGGREASVERAAQLLLARNFDFNQSMLDLILDVKASYYTLNSAYSNYEAAQEDLKDARENLTSAEQRFSSGLVSKVDVYQAKARHDDALYQLENAKGQIETDKGKLASAIGVSSDTVFDIAAPTENVPEELSNENVSMLIEGAMRIRPDIQALRSELKAKQAAIWVAGSALLPALKAGFSADAEWPHYYPDTNNNTDPRISSAQSYGAFLSVEWDIFDGFYNLNNKRAAEADYKATREKLIQAELDVSQDVWTKYFAFRTALKKRAASYSFYESASMSYELAFESYKQGLKDILDLLNAQSELSKARSRRIDSEEETRVSLAELVHSTGTLYAYELEREK